MKFIVTPMGSAGDVQPLVWLAKLLRDQGHEVVVIAQELVSDMPRRAGIKTIAYGDREEQEGVIRHPDLWHPRKGFRLLAGRVPGWAREVMPMIRGAVEPGETVLVAGALAFGARVLSEALDIPLITVHLQPSVFMSVEESPVAVAGGEWLARAPKWVRQGFMKLVHAEVDRKLRRPVNRLRREAGVEGCRAVKGIMKGWWNSPDGVVCLFPEWYARKARDWPAQAVLSRFPLYDEAEERGVDSALAGFLGEGSAPVAITPGSANVQAHRFLAQAIGACVQLKRRAVVVTRSFAHLPTPLPTGVKAFEYVAFSELFPKAAAVIHHGGIGTTAQCFAAGVPQLIMPMAHDQPDNAARVKRLGVGDYLYPRGFTAGRIAAKLEGLLGSTETRAACCAVQERMRGQMSAESVGELLQGMAERGLRIREINGPGVRC